MQTSAWGASGLKQRLRPGGRVDRGRAGLRHLLGVACAPVGVELANHGIGLREFRLQGSVPGHKGGIAGEAGEWISLVVVATVVEASVPHSFFTDLCVWLCFIIPADQKGWTQSFTLTMSLAAPVRPSSSRDCSNSPPTTTAQSGTGSNVPIGLLGMSNKVLHLTFLTPGLTENQYLARYWFSVSPGVRKVR